MSRAQRLRVSRRGLVLGGSVLLAELFHRDAHLAQVIDDGAPQGVVAVEALHRVHAVVIRRRILAVLADAEQEEFRFEPRSNARAAFGVGVEDASEPRAGTALPGRQVVGTHVHVHPRGGRLAGHARIARWIGDRQKVAGVGEKRRIGRLLVVDAHAQVGVREHHTALGHRLEHLLRNGLRTGSTAVVVVDDPQVLDTVRVEAFEKMVGVHRSAPRRIPGVCVRGRSAASRGVKGPVARFRAMPTRCVVEEELLEPQAPLSEHVAVVRGDHDGGGTPAASCQRELALQSANAGRRFRSRESRRHSRSGVARRKVRQYPPDLTIRRSSRPRRHRS